LVIEQDDGFDLTILDNSAMKIGRRTSGTVNPTIVIPPENKALAPNPATARPTI
jgi:hypothetical protein